MSGPIQVIPQGLLGMLQLKQQGQNPSELQATVQPTVDLFPLWVERLAVDIGLNTAGGISSAAVANASPGATFFSTNPLSVPQGFSWYVSSYVVACALAAAETIVLAPAIYYNLGVTTIMAPLTPPQADVITARARALRVTARNFWVPPGAALGFFVFDDLTAGSITVTGQARGVIVPI